MQVYISMDLDVDDLTQSAAHDLIADMTHEMRSSRRLRHGSWSCQYDLPDAMPENLDDQSRNW